MVGRSRNETLISGRATAAAIQMATDAIAWRRNATWIGARRRRSTLVLMKERPHMVVVKTMAATDMVLELDFTDMSGISPIAA